MTDNPQPCKICGWAAEEHHPRGHGPGHIFAGEWTPWFRFPNPPDDRDDTGRGGFATFDPLLQTFWFEIPDDDWTTAYRLLAKEGGRIVLTEVRMYPTDPPGVFDTGPGEWSGDPTVVQEDGLTARLVREHVKPGAHRDHTRERLDKMRERMGEEAFEEFMDRWGVDPSTITKLTTKRQPAPDRESRLAQMAHYYVTRVQAGSRRPVVDVSKEFSIAVSTARDEIHEARRCKLLTPTPRGTPGGQLTDRARAILSENQEAT